MVGANNGTLLRGLVSRSSKCPKLYTTMISGEQKCTPKRAKFLSKLPSQQIVVVSKYTQRWTISK